jgi:hypothetical protein
MRRNEAYRKLQEAKEDENINEEKSSLTLDLGVS